MGAQIKLHLLGAALCWVHARPHLQPRLYLLRGRNHDSHLRNQGLKTLNNMLVSHSCEFQGPPFLVCVWGSPVYLLCLILKLGQKLTKNNILPNCSLATPK